MKRQYSAAEVEKSLRHISDRVPGAFVGMDVIAGFPGETESDFEETVARLSNLPWTRLHVFPYSARPFTVAARRPDQIRRETIVARARILRELGDTRYREQAIRQVNQTKPALVLKGKREGHEAVSRDNWSIQLDQPGVVGTECPVQIRGYQFSGREIRLRGSLCPA